MARLDNSTRQKFLGYMNNKGGFTGDQYKQFEADEQSFAGGFPDFASMGQQPQQPMQPVQPNQQNGTPTVPVSPLPPAQKQTIVPPQNVTGGGQVQQPNSNQQSQQEWQGAFNSSYGSPNFNAGLDINLDGRIDGADWQQYNANGGQKNIYINRNSNGAYVDENGNPIGVTQNGNNPADDVVFGGGPRFEGGYGAPGGNFFGVDGRFSGGQNTFTGGNFQPGGGSTGQPGAGTTGLTIDQIFADPRFASIFGRGGFQGLDERISGARTDIGNDITGLGGELGGRFNGVDSALGGIRSAQDAQTNLLGGQIGSGFSGVNDRFSNIDSVLSGLPDNVRSVLEPFMRQGFGGVNENIDNLQSGVDKFGGRFDNLDALLGTGAGSLQSRIGQDIGGVNSNINNRFDSLNGSIGGVNTNINNRFNGLDSAISGRFDNADQRFNTLDTGIGDIRGDITGLGDSITGIGSNVDARYNDIQGLIDSLGGRFGDLSNDVNSRTSVGDLLKNFTGEQFEAPSIYGTVESAIKSRLGGDVADDPRVASQLADLDKSQEDRKKQRIEDLKRMGINADDGNYFSEGDELDEQFNRERLNVLATGENLRTADFGTGLNLGNSQGDLGVNQARINLDKFLGTGDLGVREKEADARIKNIEAQIKLAQQKRDDSLWSDIISGAGKILPFLL